MTLLFLIISVLLRQKIQYSINYLLITSRNDVPTLIEFLKSPEVLKSTAKKFDIKPKSLAKRISIKVVKSDIRNFRTPPGALMVALKYRNPKIGLRILNDLSSNYLEASLAQRQKRLNDGLEFINKESPALQKSTFEYKENSLHFKKNII